MNDKPISSTQRDRLRQMSSELLGLHKLLLDRERGLYEQEKGPISSTGEFLNLVLADEQFAWLRRLSGLIVEIDEALAPRSKSVSDDAQALEQAVQQRLIPDPHGDVFQRKYWEAFQDSPDVVMAHRDLLNKLKS